MVETVFGARSLRKTGTSGGPYVYNIFPALNRDEPRDTLESGPNAHEVVCMLPLTNPFPNAALWLGILTARYSSPLSAFAFGV